MKEQEVNEKNIREEAAANGSVYLVAEEAGLEQISTVLEQLDAMAMKGGRPSVATESRRYAQANPDALEYAAQQLGFSPQTMSRMSTGLLNGDKHRAFFSHLFSFDGVPLLQAGKQADLTPLMRTRTPSYFPRGIPRHVPALAIGNTGLEVATCIELGMHAVGKERARFTLKDLMQFVRWLPQQVPVTFLVDMFESPPDFDHNIDCIAELTTVTGRRFWFAHPPTGCASFYDWFLRESDAFRGSRHEKAKLLSNKLRKHLRLNAHLVAASPTPRATGLHQLIAHSSRTLEFSLFQAGTPCSSADLARRTELALIYDGLALGYRQGRIDRRWGRPAGADHDAWLYSLAPVANRAAA